MRKLFFLLFVTAFTFTANAQTKSIDLELLGSFGLASIHYDARFSGNSGLGYRVGLGYGYSNNGIDFVETKGDDGISHSIGVPVELNYLFGKKNNHFVLGAGACAGLVKSEAVSSPQFAYNIFADVAYRYQKPTGVNFFIGIKPNLIYALWPYIGIGFSF